jgi:3-isopropylmalate/(R)-2-methylmalate dehydratase small subunit
MKRYSGNVLFLDRSDINTDEIIPAKYLTEITKDALKPHALEDLSIKGFDPAEDVADKSVIITKENFGCGSSREHAPWALEVNGINVVIAVSFARIFRQNMYNCGMMAIELPENSIHKLFTDFSDSAAAVTVDLDTSVLIIKNDHKNEKIPFTISEFDRKLIETGGWVEYADTHY